MKQILILTAFLLLACCATFGVMYIFEVSNQERLVEYLLKAGGAIVLLGAFAAVATLLFKGQKKGPQD